MRGIEHVLFFFFIRGRKFYAWFPFFTFFPFFKMVREFPSPNLVS